MFRAAMAGVKPLKGQKAVKKPAIAKPKAEESSPAPERAPAEARTQSARLAMIKESASTPLAFDRDVDRSLSKGKRAIEAKLDLHGMTLAAAERAVANFLDAAVAQDLRIILIVTGKGARLQGGRVLGGRIRAEFVGWLNRADNRSRVRGVRRAHPRHGGGGAFYVLLRRRSSASSRSLRATPQR